MNKSVKAVAIGVATSLVAPMTALAYDQVSNEKDTSVLKSSNNSRAIKSMDKAGVVTGIVSNDTLNVRTEANPDSAKMGEYSYGETVIITGQEDNGWYRVDYEGKSGYVNNKYVRITGDISFPKVTANLNMRWGPSTSNGIIKNIPKGTVVRLISSDSNGWSKVYSGGDIGFVSSEYLSSNNQTSTSTSESVESISKLGKVVNVDSNDTLTIRERSNSDSRALGAIPPNTEVHLTGKASNGWFRVNYNGVTGFVNNGYIRVLGDYVQPSENVKPLNKLGKVIKVSAGDTLNIREKSNHESRQVGTIPPNAEVHVTGQADNGWYRISYNGVTGFVNNGFIQILGDYNGQESPIGQRKTNQNLNLRSGPSTDYSVILTIPRGGIVDYYSKTSDGWAKVKYNGKMGYVNAKYLTMVDTPIDPPANSNIESMTATGKVVKTSDFLNVRSQPNADSSILGKVYPNNTVSITGRDKTTGWYRINFNGSVGYVSDYYIELVNPNTANKKITTANVNLRTGPGTNYSIIKTVSSNTVVEVLSSSNGWAKVNVGGQTGYMSEDYLAPYDGTTSSGGGSLPSAKPLYSKVKIVVDPGHGGHDGGAAGHGKYEKNIILDVSRKVNSKLKSLGFQTIMTRSTDTYISLSERYNIANRNGADMFVSIHVNSGPSSASGIETLYKNYKTIANDIQNALINETGAKNRGLKYRSDLAVLNGTRMPSALVEMGFITNSSESSKLGTSSYQDKIANGIVKGITRYTDNNIRK